MPDATSAIRSSLTAVLPLVPGAVRVTVTRTDPDTGETVTTADPDTGDPVPLTNADVWGKRTAPDRSELPVGEGYAWQELAQWRVEASTVDFTVRVNDRVTDPDGVTWIVLSVKTAGLGRRFVCQCVREK